MKLQRMDSGKQQVPRETAQVEPEQVVKDTYLSHPNLEVQKFIIDTIWRCVDSRKKGEDFIFNSINYIKLWALITQEEEKDIEVVMEEPLMRYNSYNVLWNSIEKLYRVNKDFVRLAKPVDLRSSDLEDPSEEELQQMKSEYEKMKQQLEIESLQKFQFFKKISLSDLVTLNTAQTIIGTKSFTYLITANKIIKLGGTSDQILLANGDTSDLGDFLPKYYPHATGQMTIEPNDDIRNQSIRIMKNKANWDSFVLTGCNADPTDRDGSIGYGMYEKLIWGTVTSQKERVYVSLLITHSNPNTTSQSGYTLFSIVNNDIKPKFTGTYHKQPLNAVLFAQKVYGYPIDWTGADAMDFFINSIVLVLMRLWH
ncbi:MAG: hypothetical protein EZS28_010545 [Streblomastix strix]|uniref:Uncharacterized protein n=1 Tax=Streblomastix strix TaxID=222440 RepID=A0A5J4WHZ4_9EUKA|nr:MAG: hypothetical protein EZS28_010545 [Streblomastix strix]